ncbi:MAG: zinc ribbon domain-containing protein [Actinomycetota bacterium]
MDRDLFRRAKELMRERGESWAARAANASDYLLTGLLRCKRCGHGFIGTAAHGRGGTYRYYTCFSRQRHRTARCDQQRLPADPLEEAILTVTLEELGEGTLFQEVANEPERHGPRLTPAGRPSFARPRRLLLADARLSAATSEPSRRENCPPPLWLAGEGDRAGDRRPRD